jgi:multicomponent Na+:H+ antiporter subunit B
MKWVYLAAGVALFIKMLVMPNVADVSDTTIVDTIVQESGVPNAVAGIIFRNRLYDTIFEVVVFSIAILGAKFLLADEQPSSTIHQFTDKPSIVLAQLGATIAALVSIELAIRGHLSPGEALRQGWLAARPLAWWRLPPPQNGWRPCTNAGEPPPWRKCQC